MACHSLPLTKAKEQGEMPLRILTDFLAAVAWSYPWDMNH